MRKHAVHALELMQKGLSSRFCCLSARLCPSTLEGLERFWKSFPQGLLRALTIVLGRTVSRKPFLIDTCIYRFVWRYKNRIRRV